MKSTPKWIDHNFWEVMSRNLAKLVLKSARRKGEKLKITRRKNFRCYTWPQGYVMYTK